MKTSLTLDEFIRYPLLEGRKEDYASLRQEKFEEIKAFYAKMGRLPSRTSEDEYERNLEQKLRTLFAYPEVRAWREAIKPIRVLNPKAMFEKIKAFYSEMGRLPSRTAEDAYERHLGVLLKKYIWAYPEVRAWREAIKPIQSNNINDTFDRIKDFVAKTGKIPSEKSNDIDERRLASSLYSLATKHPEIKAWREAIKPIKPQKSWEESWEALKQYYEKYQKLPSSISSDEAERKLALQIPALTAPSSPRRKEEVVAWVKEIKERIKAQRRADKLADKLSLELRKKPNLIRNVIYKKPWGE